ncbi:lipopolysaccharide biosynthesis protein, partial [Vibrio fluvialis]
MSEYNKEVNNLSTSSKSVFKGMITLVVGSGLSRIIGIISIPLITRFYSPSDYGVLALYVSFVTIISPFFTMRYVQAIPLPKRDEIAINLFSLCVKLILIWSVITSLIFYLFSKTIFELFDARAVSSYWWIIIVGSAGMAFYELLSLWSTREKKFRAMSRSQVNQSLIGNITKIILGALSFKPIGLILGQFLNQSSGVVSLYNENKNKIKELKTKISIDREIKVAFHFREFLYYRFPSHLLMIGSIQAPLLMSALLFNKNVTGQLNLAIMVLSMPAYMIGHAMARAFYSEIASIGKGNLKKIQLLTFKLQRKLFIVSIPLVIAIASLSEFLFSLVFGKTWEDSGLYAAILSPYIMFQFTSSPLMEVINIVGKQYYFLILNLIR